MTSTYYIIHNSEGDTTVEEVTKEELLKRLNDDYYGSTLCMEEIEERDTNYWGEGNILVIKGHIVTPVEKKVVTEFDID